MWEIVSEFLYERNAIFEVFAITSVGPERLIFSINLNYRRGAPRKRGGAPPGIKGRARFRFEESFYQNPYPECICGSSGTENRRTSKFKV